MFVQISQSNARDFFAWIGVDSPGLIGEIPARELAALLRRRLWPERKQDGDAGILASVHARPSRATLIDLGRPAGRLAAYAVRLLRLAEHAGDGVIFWA